MFTLTLLLLSPVLTILLFKVLFSFFSPKKIMEKYEGQTISGIIKKYPEADVHRFRPVFLQIGLGLAMLTTLYAFSYTEYVEQEIVGVGPVVCEIPFHTTIKILPPITTLPPPPPPLPPPPSPLPPLPTTQIVVTKKNVTAPSPLPVRQIPPVKTPSTTSTKKVNMAITTKALKRNPKPTPKPTPKPESIIFTIVEEMPEFQGGQKALFEFLGKKTNYPAMARENGIEGTVYIGFVVMEDGTISNIHIKRGLPSGGAGCDKEALRVVGEMPTWKPGKQRGKAVRVAYTLPFKFKLH